MAGSPSSYVRGTSVTIPCDDDDDDDDDDGGDDGDKNDAADDADNDGDTACDGCGASH